ncbi:MAG TPA: hemolysin family protein [Candidatus Fusicatenibacter merdavium]|uniref:Hemolysin family protein n=1 Tax=Candidatus Fusicatenibacter merdavium TaxID=2838600 RepID=A0A9D1XBV2_9FIRM|nr:hemolysin family protein [Candidatus Fusicatenibacter merdavium]
MIFLDGDIAGSLILQIVLIAINAIFACVEIAVVSINDTKLEKMVSDGNKKAIRLQKLTSQPSRFLATIQVAITLSGFLGSAFAADNFSEPLVAWLLSIGVPIPEKTLDTIAVVLITLILSYVTLIFGELVPKRVAMNKTEAISLGLSGMITFVSKVFAPLVWLLTASTNGVLRLLGIDPNEKEDEVTEEEIRMMVDAGSEKGAIDCEEKELIQNVFEFNDISVEEICTHRTDVAMLWMDESIDEWEEIIHESRHSYFPVCGEDVDDIIGILDAKDYFRLREKNHEIIMREAIKPAYFVPENIKASTLFQNMKKSGNYFAVVLDEYGGMEGIITVRDLIEELVGDLSEEQEADRQQEIEQVNDDTWKILGTTQLDDVAEALDVELPLDEYDTFGGYIFGELGAVPDDGSQFELETPDLKIKVVKVKDHRVENTVVKKIEHPKEDEGEEDKKEKE